ncbi:MAG TPA: PfkB family carbohydrate kinase [Gemmatimonadales bacterium]|nr:PfkB family carbohydrate kinase [Gemmatimonadales bacterium]
MSRFRPAPPLPRARLEEILARLAGRHLVVLGDAMLDRYLVGDVERISPEAPVPVVRITARQAALGGAANVAANLAAMGARPRLVALVGQDQEGETVRAGLAALGLDGRGLVEVPDRPTTVKTRVVARGQQVVRLDEEVEAPVSGPVLERLRAEFTAALDGADAVVLEDYNKGVLVPELIRQAVEAARGRGIPVVVDPKYRGFFDYGGATVFKPNRHELAAALGAMVDLERSHAAELREIVSRLGVEHVLLTLREEGMLLISRDGEPVHLPAVRREMFDVSGAGDTVVAWVAGGLAAGGSVLEAAGLANLAAGVEVGKRGIRAVTPDEVLALHGEG